MKRRIMNQKEIQKILDKIQKDIRIVGKYFENNSENYDIRNVLCAIIYVTNIQCNIYDLEQILSHNNKGDMTATTHKKGRKKLTNK